jgi:hypothetical protein
MINLNNWLFNLVDNFTFYKGGGGGGGSTSQTNNQLDPTIRPFVEYGLNEAQNLYKTQSPEYYAGQTYVSPSAQTTSALQAAQNQVANQLAGSQQLGNLDTSTQGLGLGDVNALSTMGGQQQTIAQNQQLFPMQTAAQQAALLRGYTVPTSVNSSYTGPIPGAYSASPLAQIAGVGSLLGALNTTNAAGGKTPAQNLYAGLYGVGSDIYKALTGTKTINDFATSADYMNYIGANPGAAYDPSLSSTEHLNELYGDLGIF